MLPSPCITFIPVTIATLFMRPFGNDKGDWGKRLTAIHRLGHTINLIIKIFLYWSHSLVSIHMRHKYLHIFCPSTYLFSKLPCHQLSDRVPSKSLTIQPNHWPQPMNQYKIACLVISPSRQSEQLGSLLKVLSTGKIYLHHFSRNGPSVNLVQVFSSCQFIIGNSPRGHGE